MAIALVQSAIDSLTSTTASVGTSHTGIFASNVAAGNLLIVSMTCYNGSSGPTINTPTDTRGNTYLPVTAQGVFLSPSAVIRSWYCISGSSGANTVTITTSLTTSNPTMIISEWSGAAASPLDKTNLTNSGSGTPFSAGATGVLTQADEMVYAFVYCDGDGTAITEDTADGFTLLRKDQAGAAQPAAAQYKIVSATTSLTPNWTYTGGTTYAAHVGTFMAGGAAAAAADTIRVEPLPLIPRGRSF